MTEQEAEQGKALEVCLDEIERCRPFFIGLLGERYGWVPPRYEVPDEPQYYWVRHFEPEHSITALEIYHGVLNNPQMTARAFFYFRDPSFLSEVPEQSRSDFLTENGSAAEKLRRLKGDIRECCPVFENYPCRYSHIDESGTAVLNGLEAFSRRVLEDLWSAISQEHPQDEAPPDELAMERAYHEAFIEACSKRFIGRRDLLTQMTAHADGEDQVPLVVTGAPGYGKSALLASFVKQYAAAHQNTFTLAHFIGVSPGSTDIRRTLRRLVREIVRHFQLIEQIPEEYQELRIMFSRVLEEACSRSRVMLVVDALNQLDESYGAHALNWLPEKLPRGARLIVSTLEGDCLRAVRRRQVPSPELHVERLADEDRRQLVRETLWDYRKRLDERPGRDQLSALLVKRESDNPLYIVVACEELRVFGEFERVPSRIERFPDEVGGLLDQVLERIEHDHGRELVAETLSLLACSRQGLLETELLEFLRS